MPISNRTSYVKHHSLSPLASDFPSEAISVSDAGKLCVGARWENKREEEIEHETR